MLSTGVVNEPKLAIGGSGLRGVTFVTLRHVVQRHLPKPFALSFVLPDSGSFKDSFAPAAGFVANALQHAEVYSFTGPRLTTGFTAGLLFFAQRARFSLRDSPFPEVRPVLNFGLFCEFCCGFLF
jgi:hypothetical protein